MDRKEKIKIGLKSLIPYFISIALGLIFALLFIYLAQPAIVSGSSMMPTYKSGQILKSNRKYTEKDLTRGTVVVAKPSGYQIIKRIIALPGEEIQIIDGYIYINGEINHEFDFELIEDPGIAVYPILLRKDEYFIMGDNRNNSNDSRFFGPVTKEEIKSIIIGNMF